MSGCSSSTPKPQGNPAAERLSDQLIYASVKGDLAAQPRLESSRISVEVTEGVVVLSGTVPDDERKTMAEAIARGVKGVKGVADLLQFP